MNELIKSRLGDDMVSKRVKHVVERYDLSDINEILDIGSWHLGQAIEFQNIFTDAKVTAFEPVPESFQLCHHYRKEYNKPNIDIFNLALSDIDGQVKFFAVDPNQSTDPNVGASSMLKFIDGLNGSFFNRVWIQKEIEVESMRLDTWCEKYNKSKIDVIWMDTQGTELQVLQGGTKTLENVKLIFTEVGLKPYYEGHSLKDDIDNFLTERGFIEIKDSFELNGFDYEANTIYVNEKNFSK
jgi:FkbM family methyltransferase